MKRILVVTALLIASSAAHAQPYKIVWDDVQKPWRSDFEINSDVQADASECERVAGEQRGAPTAQFRKCMLRHHWKFSHLEPLPIEEHRDVIPGVPTP
jgi:hypothetical protein